MVLIVIPTIGRESLQALLASLPRTPELFRVVVVVDAAANFDRVNATANLALEGLRSKTEIIRSLTPGVNGARNYAYRHIGAAMRGRIIVNFDDDVSLPSDFTWDLLEREYDAPEVLAVGGRYLTNAKSQLIRGYNLMCNGWRVASGTSDREMMIGGVWSIRGSSLLEALSALGEFDETIRYGGAETLYMHKLRHYLAKRGRVAYSPRLDVFHNPAGRSVLQWLCVSARQALQVNREMRSYQPRFRVRMYRLVRHLRKLSLSDRLTFICFASLFVIAGRCLAIPFIIRNIVTKSR